MTDDEQHKELDDLNARIERLENSLRTSRGFPDYYAQQQKLEILWRLAKASIAILRKQSPEVFHVIAVE